MLISNSKCLAISAAVIALGLSGCKHDQQGSQVAGWSLVDPAQRHPIIVTQQPSNLSLAVAKEARGLSLSQRADVAEFANRYRAGDAGNSRLVISAPSGSANETAAMDAVDDVRHILASSGFSESNIVVEAYRASNGAQAPVRISYLKYVAEGPDCSHNWSENSATDTHNIGSPNFGCASQRNLAAMVANPADLLGPRGFDQRSSERRDTVTQKWIRGETTASQKSDDERASTAGSN